MGDCEVILAGYTSTSYCNPQWVLFIDPDSKKPYFFNTDSGETSWEDPEPPLGAKGINEEYVGNPSSVEGVNNGSDDDSFILHEIASEMERGLPPYLSDAWKLRPARKQTENDSSKVAYREGSDRYNIWYHRVSVDRFDESVRFAASSACDPWLDSGTTQADSKKAENASFCLWFAKGACSQGPKCWYKHHVPTRRDDQESDQMFDVFGRERHAHHKDDMGGVGSFLKECNCLYISELILEEGEPQAVQKLEAELWKLFHPWGPIVSVRVIPSRLIAFVKFEYRFAAEFAKVACANQPCGKALAINVRWAFEDPNPRAAEQAEIDSRDQFYSLVERKIAEMSYQERLERGLLSRGQSEGDFENRFETTSPSELS
jgi:hypothetical protein